MTKADSTKTHFQKSIHRLRLVLQEPTSDIVRDSAILRFEVALDLAWKAIKAHIDIEHGIVCTSPKSCFREAFRVGLIDYDDAWLRLVDLRNQTMHTYDEKLADVIFGELPGALSRFESLLAALQR